MSVRNINTSIVIFAVSFLEWKPCKEYLSQIHIILENSGQAIQIIVTFL